MAPMPVPPADGGDDDPVSGLQQGLRLSDVEGIAARRLDGALSLHDGRLKLRGSDPSRRWVHIIGTSQRGV